MNKEIYFVKDRRIIQERLAKIKPPSKIQRFRNHFWGNLFHYIIGSFFIVFFIVLLVIVLFGKFNYNGTKADGSFSLLNLATGSNEANENGNLLGTNSHGRDNLTLFSVSWLNVLIYVATAFSMSIPIALPFSYFIRLFKQGMLFTERLKKYEGMLLLPVSMILAAIFMPNSFIFFTFLTAIPIAISLAYEINIQKELWKKRNLAFLEFAATTGWEGNIIVRNIIILVKAFTSIFFQSMLFMMFWEFQFSYFELIQTFDSFLIGKKETIGGFTINCLEQIMNNPEIVITITVSVILILSIISVLSGNQIDKRIAVISRG